MKMIDKVSQTVQLNSHPKPMVVTVKHVFMKDGQMFGRVYIPQMKKVKCLGSTVWTEAA